MDPDPDSDADPDIFVIVLQDVNKKQIFVKSFSAYYRYLFFSFFKDKNQNEVAKQ